MKEKIIDIEAHAFFRMLGRGTAHGLDLHETKQRAFQTVREGKKQSENTYPNKVQRIIITSMTIFPFT